MSAKQEWQNPAYCLLVYENACDLYIASKEMWLPTINVQIKVVGGIQLRILLFPQHKLEYNAYNKPQISDENNMSIY